MDWIEHPEPALTDGGRVQLVACVGQAADGRHANPHHGLSEPQAYRVDTPQDQPPLRTHLHTADQFQYVGWGGLGRDPKGRRSLTLDLRTVVAARGPGGWTRLVDDAGGLVISVAACAAGQDVQGPEIEDGGS